MSEWRKYRRRGVIELREHMPGESLAMISVSAADEDKTAKPGGMIARNPDNHADQWYVARDYFWAHYDPV